MFKTTSSNNTQSKSNDAAFLAKASSSSFIQPKLNIGKSGDRYEVEADQMADQVVAKSHEQSSSFFTPSPPIQKQVEEDTLQEKPLVESITPTIQLNTEDNIQEKCADCDKEDAIQKMDDDTLQPQQEEGSSSKENENTTSTTTKPVIQKAPEEDIQEKEDEEVQKKEDEEVQLQMQAAGSDENPSSDLEKNLTQSKGEGSPLAPNTRREMESSFGADFSGVRVHNNSNAVQMNQQLGAQAFTNGNDIYFNEGKYSPNTDSGKHLLAHELTHTVQQGATSSDIQKSEGPCARDPEAQPSEECAPSSATPNSQASLTSEEPPEGTEEPETDAEPVENQPQPAENETPNPENEVENENLLEEALSSEDPLSDSEEVQETDENEQTEDQNVQDEAASLVETNNALSTEENNQASTATSAINEQLAQVESLQSSQLEQFITSRTSVENASNKVQSLRGLSVKYAPHRMQNGVKTDVEAKTLDIANIQSTQLIHSLVDQTAMLADYSSMIDSRINQAVETQKERLQLTIDTKKNAILARIMAAKNASESRALTAKANIKATFIATSLQIELDAALAISEITAAKESALTRIDSQETAQLANISSIYDTSKTDIESRGITVGNEAAAIGTQRSNTYENDKINEWDSWYEGHLTDRRAEARMKAAIDVSNSYKEGLVDAAAEQASSAMEGKQGDLDNVSATAQQSRDSLQSSFDQIITQLETSKSQSISSATSAHDTAISGVDSAQNQTINSLNQQQRSQIEMLDNTLQAKSASLEAMANQAKVSQFDFLAGAINQMYDQILGIHSMLNGQEVPDNNQIGDLFNQIEASVDMGIAQITDQFETLLIQTEQTTIENGNTTEATIIVMVDEVFNTINSIDSNNRTSINSITDNTITGLTTISNSFTTSASMLVISSSAQFDEVASQLETLFMSAAESIQQRFTDSANNLENSLRCALNDLREDITCYANEAASHEPPAWKTVVKWILIIAIVVLVAVFLGPAVIGLAGGLLGSTMAGAIVGGAIVGAIAGGTIQVISNWETNRDLGEGVGQAMLIGAIGGAIGGGVSAVLGGTSLGVVSKFAVETVADGLVEIGVGVIGGTFTWENFGWSMLMNVGMNIFTSGLSANSRVGKTQQRIMVGAGDVGAGIRGGSNPFRATGGAGDASPRIEGGDIDVDVRTPGAEASTTRTNSEIDAPNGTTRNQTDIDTSGTNTSPKTETDTSNGGTRTTDNNDAVGPRTESDSSGPTSHRNTPEIEEGTGIVAQFRTPDGHTIKVLQDGRIMICSVCGELRMKYADELASDSTLLNRINDIEALRDPTTKGEQALALRNELEALRANNTNLAVKTGNELAVEAGLTGAPDGYTWVNRGGSLHLRKLSNTPNTRPSSADLQPLLARFGENFALALPRLEAHFPGAKFSELAGFIRNGRISGEFDQFGRIKNGTEPDATAALGELAGFVRALNRGHDSVNALVPPSGRGAPQGVRTPEAETTTNGTTRGLEVKTSDPTVAPKRSSWNSTFDKANKQIKGSSSGTGEIQFDFSNSRLEPGTGLSNQSDIESFMRGKMTDSRGRRVTYFEIIWRDPVSGNLMVSSRTRSSSGIAQPVTTQPL